MFDDKATTHRELVDSRRPELIDAENRLAHGAGEPGDLELFAPFQAAERRILGGEEDPVPKKRKPARRSA